MILTGGKIMKSRKTLLVIFLVIASVVGIATLQDTMFEGDQSVTVNQISPDEKIVTVQIVDGIGSGDDG